MNKAEFVASVAEKATLSKAQAGEAVDAVINTIAEALKAGGDVRLPGLGTFAVSQRKATTGRNPATGATIQIPARNVPKFTAGKGLKDAVSS
jgi:Bacterial nucleoid DNA-binding protein